MGNRHGDIRNRRSSGEYYCAQCRAKCGETLIVRRFVWTAIEQLIGAWMAHRWATFRNQWKCHNQHYEPQQHDAYTILCGSVAVCARRNGEIYAKETYFTPRLYWPHIAAVWMCLCVYGMSAEHVAVLHNNFSLATQYRTITLHGTAVCLGLILHFHDFLFRFRFV